MDGGVHLYHAEDRRRFSDKAKAILQDIEARDKMSTDELALNINYAQAWIALAAL